MISLYTLLYHTTPSRSCFCFVAGQKVAPGRGG
jgi:hypothetical protein